MSNQVKLRLINNTVSAWAHNEYLGCFLHDGFHWFGRMTNLYTPGINKEIKEYEKVICNRITIYHRTCICINHLFNRLING